MITRIWPTRRMCLLASDAIAIEGTRLIPRLEQRWNRIGDASRRSRDVVVEAAVLVVGQKRAELDHSGLASKPLRIVRGILLKGASIESLLGEVAAIGAFFCVALTVAVLTFRKRLD